MQILTTIFQLAVVWVAAYAMGYAAVKVLMPRDIEQEFGPLVTPTVGYLLVCFVTFSFSGATGLSTATSTWIVMAAFAGAAVLVQLRPEWRIRPMEVLAGWKRALVLALPMAAVTLQPLFRFGPETYLGAVNPDYFAGILDNWFLLSNDYATTAFAATGKDSWYPVPNTAGHLTVSARFAADLFGVAIQQILQVETRTSLTLAIGFFLLNLPLTLYFFCRVAVNMPETPARWSAWLIGVSGPIGLSFLYFYIGQNSGLPALPLLLVAVYLLLMRPSWKTLLFCALLSNALFINYFAMLPYALAPGGALAIYLIVKRRLSLAKAVGLGVAFLAMSVLFKLGTLQFTYASMRAWGAVIGQTLQGQFFLDFLTESFFPFFLGVHNYPSNAWLVRSSSELVERALAVPIAFGLFALWVMAVRRWWKENRDDASRVFVLSAMVIYAMVWWRYTFLQQYGYAVFKMASWLQFMLVPFFAYALWRAREELRSGAPGRRPRLVMAGCVAYIALNVITSAIYAYNGGGTNTDHGYIVNHFGTAGNRDYFEVAPEVAKRVPPDKSVGMIFTDSMRHYWNAYYLRDQRLSILAHETMPGDDENLPDVETHKIVDYYGNVRNDFNDFFHTGAADDFYLTWGTKDLNHDIADPKFIGEPLWENGSFRLYPASAAKDIVFTSRGFYRVEFFKPMEHWFPSVLRWSADGGEFYLIRPSAPGGKYRLAFDALVGFEYPSETRTLEIWRDEKKIQELTITSTARVVTEPFDVNPGTTKLVVTVKERNKPLPRRLGLWNRDIPADYRRLNVGFSNVRALPPDAPLPPGPKLGETVAFLQWHPHAYRFDGLESDGWMDKRAQVTMAVPAGAKHVAVRGFAPGNLRFTFPLDVTLTVNGREVKTPIAQAGVFEVGAPLEEGAKSAEVVIRTTQSQAIGERALRSKFIYRGLRLDSLEFK